MSSCPDRAVGRAEASSRSLVGAQSVRANPKRWIGIGEHYKGVYRRLGNVHRTVIMMIRGRRAGWCRGENARCGAIKGVDDVRGSSTAASRRNIKNPLADALPLAHVNRRVL